MKKDDYYVLVALLLSSLVSLLSACNASLYTQTQTPEAYTIPTLESESNLSTTRSYASEAAQAMTIKPTDINNDTIIFNNTECDFDGDGVKENVILSAIKDYYSVLYVEITSGSMNYHLELDVEHIANIAYTETVDLDENGGEELIIVASPGSTGGWMDKSLIVLTHDGSSIRHCYAGGLYGFTGKGIILPEFKAEFTVNESNKSFLFPINDDSFLLHDGYYNEDGELLKDMELRVDGIGYYSLNKDKRTVEIAQLIWSISHIEGEYCLFSEISFNKNGYIIISQRIETTDYVYQFADELRG